MGGLSSSSVLFSLILENFRSDILSEFIKNAIFPLKGIFELPAFSQPLFTLCRLVSYIKRTLLIWSLLWSTGAPQSLCRLPPSWVLTLGWPISDPLNARWALSFSTFLPWDGNWEIENMKNVFSWCCCCKHKWPLM